MWVFREHEFLDRWIWIQFGHDGRTLQRSRQVFSSWFAAVADATVHGFDHGRDSFEMRPLAVGDHAAPAQSAPSAVNSCP
jgi:hypothetical protein